MTTTLLDDVAENPAQDTDTEVSTAPADGPQDGDLDGGFDGTMPDYLPEKFWDPEAREVRVDDLARSYARLEKRLGAAGGDTVPDDPGGYRIDLDGLGLEPDPEVNARLMDAGFTQEQAQLVYSLASEKLAPIVRDMARETLRGEELRRLADHFGGADKWQTLSGQMSAWGEANLPAPVFAALANSFDGVLTLHRMMSDGEPELLSGAQPAPRGRSEADLKKMMEDPRYWRDHDPAFVAEVRQGFEDLYPDAG